MEGKEGKIMYAIKVLSFKYINRIFVIHLVTTRKIPTEDAQDKIRKTNQFTPKN